jgi:hypothetical protein
MIRIHLVLIGIINVKSDAKRRCFCNFYVHYLRKLATTGEIISRRGMICPSNLPFGLKSYKHLIKNKIIIFLHILSLQSWC